MKQAALCAVDLAVKYGETVALGSSSFVVDSGELIAVVGQNGSGKSSLFKALAGFVDHDGDVVIHGERCHHLERRAIAYIPQQSEVDIRFPITVAEVVMAGRRRFHRRRMRPTTADRDTVEACLAGVDLADAADRPLHVLSGGQLQRVFIARALAQEADVLLLDEALSGVDAGRTERLIALFADLAAGGTSVLVSMHDLAAVRRHFPRCLTLNGRLVGDGPPRRELAPRRIEALFTVADTGGVPT